MLACFCYTQRSSISEDSSGEHSTRNYEEEHVRSLTWNRASIDELLKEKVRRLDSTFFADSGGSKRVQDWLGQQTLRNQERNIDEPIRDYILRHTRLLPRDIVTLGNVLCQERQRAKWFDYMPDEAITRGVRFVARKFCSEQLAICASQIATDLPATKENRSQNAKFMGIDEYQETLAEKLRAFISGFKKDRFGVDVLRRQEDQARLMFPDHPDILSVLWLNGLLGYVDSSRKAGYVTFYSDEAGAEFKLPRSKSSYAFHSCVADGVEIKSVGQPVLQWS